MVTYRNVAMVTTTMTIMTTVMIQILIAKIKPIFKSCAKTDIGNYRPVSLLPQFTKNLEKLFLNRLDNFHKIRETVL